MTHLWLSVLVQKWGGSHKGSVAPCCDDTAQPLSQDLRCVGQTTLMPARLQEQKGPNPSDKNIPTNSDVPVHCLVPVHCIYLLIGSTRV